MARREEDSPSDLFDHEFYFSAMSDDEIAPFLIPDLPADELHLQPPPPPPLICEICTEARQVDQMFRNRRCGHSFCSECITNQVVAKIKDRIAVVPCLGLNCRGELKIDDCRSVLPENLIESWGEAMSEALLLTSQKLYCPFRDCGAMIMMDENGREEIRESECPFCHRLFCAKCGVSWHHGVGCEEFQTLNVNERGRDDLLVREMANQKKWRKCPRCKFIVEKIDGCLHITCRCRYEFCYACGEKWTSTHGGCQ